MSEAQRDAQKAEVRRLRKALTNIQRWSELEINRLIATGDTSAVTHGIWQMAYAALNNIPIR